MGPFVVNRVMPQQALTPVGAFVFLDHFDSDLTPEQVPKPDGTFAHPHRGIATLTYLIHGEVTHLDSYGHKGTVTSGGVQWMNAGNGIVHDEWAKPVENRLAGLQFWLNLSSKAKAQKPSYKAISSEQLPVLKVGQKDSYLKVIIGRYQGFSSDIPVEGRQSLYHLSLKAGDKLALELNHSDQYAVFLASGLVQISGQTLTAKQQGYVQAEQQKLTVIAEDDSELFVYGGQQYNEPIVSGGPFVMNTQPEMHAAYQDYQAGLYGKIDYRPIMSNK